MLGVMPPQHHGHLFFLPIMWTFCLKLSVKGNNMLNQLKIFAQLKSILETLMLVIKDCSTSANGDYDPARVVGYGITMLGAIEFFVMTAYSTFKTGTFDVVQFSIGLTGVSAALAAAAAGVLIKKSTEITPPSVTAEVSKTIQTPTGETTVTTSVTKP